jgi:hypothetical protein
MAAQTGAVRAVHPLVRNLAGLAVSSSFCPSDLVFLISFHSFVSVDVLALLVAGLQARLGRGEGVAGEGASPGRCRPRRGRSANSLVQ